MKTLYIRKGKRIETLNGPDDDSTYESFKSLNKAKKKSRELQNANGGLGLGSLMVV